MTITLEKTCHPGLYLARLGKRRINICQPYLDLANGIAISDADVRQAMNDCTAPGDKLADESTKVIRKHSPAPLS